MGKITKKDFCAAALSAFSITVAISGDTLMTQVALNKLKQDVVNAGSVVVPNAVAQSVELKTEFQKPVHNEPYDWNANAEAEQRATGMTGHIKTIGMN